MIALLLAGFAAQLSEDERFRLVLDRFTAGPTPSLVEEVRSRGLRTWFQEQLRSDLAESEELTKRLERFETLGLSAAEIVEKYDKKEGKNATPQEKKEARRLGAIPPVELFAWIVLRSVYGRRHVRETSTDFFRNHFSISVEKQEIRFLATEWERDVLYARSLGPFGEMLEATAHHPAMLLFLDNHLSRRPPSPQELKEIEARTRRRTGSEDRAEEAVNIAKQRGLNENYARELLELHTLGVDNHYTQQDVIEVARGLTGWTIQRRVWSFRFDPRMHSGGEKTVLGQKIAEHRSGPGEGMKILDVLQRHPGTARFLAWKLCRWFVNDQPEPDMVERIAQVFARSGGDLAKVYSAIVDDPSFFTRANYRTKFKRPWEFVVSALRATQADVIGPAGLNQALVAMNEPLYRCADPTGFYDQSEAWCDPGAMAARWAFANDVVRGRIAGVRISSSLFSELSADRPEEWNRILSAKILPAVAISRETSASLDRLLTAERAKKSSPAQAGAVLVAALLGSPEFQRQ